MANIKDGLDILFKLEFNSPSNVLEQNKNETGYTLFGIYQKANPTWYGWNTVEQMMLQYKDMKSVSKRLYDNEYIRELVEELYKTKYWDVAKLDSMDSQHKANEIFIFGVNAGMKIAIKTAQQIVWATDDGIVGSKTLELINKFDEAQFDLMYDEREILHYDEIIASKPEQKIYANGWRNRAIAVWVVEENSMPTYGILNSPHICISQTKSE